MSSINEAYARIDYAYLKSLENQIEDIKRVLANIKGTHSINGQTLGYDKVQLFTLRRRVAGNEKNVKIKFPTPFASGSFPTVSITVADADARFKSIVITQCTNEFVSFRISEVPGILYRGDAKTAGFSVHIIAIGSAS